MNARPRSVASLMLAGLAAFCFWFALAPAQSDAAEAAGLENPASLASALRGGGFVIYFRHADTGPAYQEQGVDLNRCETQRNLNEQGRVQARQIGAQFRRAGIPVGSVWSSAFCRCRETAELAFGRYEIDSVLTGASRAPEAASRRESAARGLKTLLATRPAGAVNTVLVSHGYNLWDAEGFHLGTQGEAAVYRPDGRGGYALVARLTPDAWERLPDR